jgi:hypothetical protein
MRLATMISLLALGVAPALAAEPPKPPPAALSLAPSRVVEAYRPLPLGPEDARLTGEIGTRVVPLYLLPSEAARPAKLRLAYQSAVSVLPEGSRIAIAVNDATVGERTLRSATRPETLTFDLPPGLLTPGYNAVRITVRQAHRVDCSREASYELWTQILPDSTGLVFQAAPAEIRDIRDLPAIRPTANGTVPIRVRASAGLDAESLGRLSRAVQSVVLAGGLARPTVEFSPEPGTEPGLDLLVGTEAALEAASAALPPGAGPRVHLQHDLPSERVILSVTGRTQDEVDAALKILQAAGDAAAKPLGSPAGLRALTAAYGYRVAGNETVPLAALGFATQRFAGRYYRQSGFLQMPADFYPGDYGRITLALDATYAADLAPASRIAVRVNGAIVSNVPLQKKTGDILSKKEAFLPLSVFKPGVNSIDIEADTTALSDAECSPVSQMQTRDRLLVAGTAELDIPGLARIATFPSLSGVPSGALSGLNGTEPLELFLPHADPETVEAAFGLVARITAIAGRLQPVAFSFERPRESAAHVLTIGALGDVPPATLAAAGLDAEALQRIWRGAGESDLDQQAALGPVRVAFVGSDLIMASTAATASDAKETRVPAASPAPGGPAGQDGTGADMLKSEAEELLGPLMTEVRAAMDSVRAAASGSWVASILDDRGEAPPVATASSTLVIAQGAAPRGFQAHWQASLLPDVTSMTVFVAPTPELLQAGMADFLSTGLWQQLSGNAAAYDRGEAVLRSRSAEAAWFVPTQTLTPGNLRLIIAGWLSQNIAIYLGALAALAVVLTGFTYRLVRISGVRE